ncbi:MAG TPA: hypothetical protein VI727_10785 [Candidatus Brocadiaceae bacterium]|nr:hypothetical protein [Candidatus Brocadiaceae bacterium]
MFEIFTPDTDTTKSIQAREMAYYWSRCTEGFFRKHGLVGVRKCRSGEVPENFVLTTRHTSFCKEIAESAGCMEGPVDEQYLKHMGISCYPAQCTLLKLFSVDDKLIGELAYQYFTVRKIPADRKEVSHPYVFLSQNHFWNNHQIHLQVFDDIRGNGWQPIAYACFDNSLEKLLIGVSDGHRVVLGLPILDLICSSHAFAPLDAGYYEHIRGNDFFAIEKWFIELLVSHALRSGIPVVSANEWPTGYTSAFTVRHDLDRPISDDDLRNLLAYYNERDIKSSWGLLARQFNVEHARLLLSRGHEVNLHTEAPTFDKFAEEVTHLTTTLSRDIDGYTAHGGIGAAGFLGDVQYGWAVDSKMVYGEMLGHSNSLPHSLNRVCGDFPEIVRLIAPATHHSLDAGTKPDAHHLAFLKNTLPEAFNNQEHVVLMNHPDIHRVELQKLIDSLDLSTTWKATFIEVAHWCDIAKFTNKIIPNKDGITIMFEDPLPLDTTYTLFMPNGNVKNISYPMGSIEQYCSIYSI